MQAQIERRPARQRSVFAGRLLSDAAFPQMEDNMQVSRFLLDTALEDLGGKAIVGPDPETDEQLAEMMASEAIHAIERKDSPSASNWYTKAIERMIAIVALIHPEIGSDEEASKHPSGLFRDRHEARTVLFAAMAITSQNNAVNENMRYALEQYRAFCEDGAFSPKVYGANGFAIESNLSRFNFILERAGGNLTRVRKLLSMKMRMGDLQQVAKRYGINLPGKELADETVYGSMLFGPKVGNGFYQNLIGEHSPVTIDLWFMRMWGRYTGTLLRDEITGDSRARLVKGVRRSLRGARMGALMEKEGLKIDPSSIWDMDSAEILDYSRRMKRFWERLRKDFVSGAMSGSFTSRQGRRGPARANSDASELKARLIWPGAAESILKSLGMPQDSPRNASARRWIRSVVSLSLDKLREAGYPMTAADMQAILWYPEKEIYGKLAGRPSERLNLSYDEAAARIAASEGVDLGEIEAAILSVGEDRRRRQAGPEGTGRSEREPDGGLGRRAA